MINISFSNSYRSNLSSYHSSVIINSFLTENLVFRFTFQALPFLWSIFIWAPVTLAVYNRTFISYWDRTKGNSSYLLKGRSLLNVVHLWPFPCAACSADTDYPCSSLQLIHSTGWIFFSEYIFAAKYSLGVAAHIQYEFLEQFCPAKKHRARVSMCGERSRYLSLFESLKVET